MRGSFSISKYINEIVYFFWFVLMLFCIFYVQYLYTLADVTLVQSQLQELGYTNVVVGEKSFEFGGFGRCIRDDVASFDFTATINEKVLDNYYVCIGVRLWDPINPHITLREK